MDRLAAAIAAAGVRRVFGIPGAGPSLTLIDHLERLGVAFTTTCFEGSAALMAGADGRLSGRAGVAVAIKGPGLANLIPGLAVCHLEGWPVVAVTESYTPDAPVWRRHKRMDHGAMTAGVTKGRRRLSDAGPGYAQLAAWAEADRPGPIHLDIQAERVASDEPVDATAAVRRGGAATGARPVIIAGSGAIRQGLSDVLNGLKVPVFSTAAAKGVVDETLPHAAGVWTGAGKSRAPEGEILAASDCVIGVGLTQDEVLGRLPDHTELDLDALPEADWGTNLVGRRVQGLRKDLLDRPFGPAHVFDAVERRLGAEGVRTVLDTGWFCTVGEHVIRTPSPGLHLSSGAGRSMGAGLPTAIGGAFADGGVPTVAYVGDGGGPMFLSEARVAVEAALPLLIVVMSDGGFGSILTGALATGRTRAPLTFAGRGWGGALEGMGLPGTRVTDLDAVERALLAWDPSTGPAWIEAKFDEASYQRMVEDLR